jgi:hypothetical protein
MEFMPEHAPLAVMAFLGTVFLLGLCLVAFLLALAARKKWLSIAATSLATALVTVYLLALLGVSLTSHEKLLALGERKYFCEVDCHIAYSVAGVEERAALGDELHQTQANGRFVIVHLKTWFDPSTISPHRGNGELAPGSRRIFLVDNSGRHFATSAPAQSALAKRQPSSPFLNSPLRPGESYVSDLVFEVPAGAQNLRLFVGDSYLIPDEFLIGHEDSFLHKKIFLALTPGDTISAGRLP